MPLQPFLAESARSSPGGIWWFPPTIEADTTGITMYGQRVHIFSPDEIRELVSLAAGCGLSLVGELALAHAERPVHWKRTGLDYTFLRLTFRRDG